MDGINQVQTPVDYVVAKRVIDSYHLADLGRATIREVVAIAGQLEKETGVEFIRMEMGVPGLPPTTIGVDAEIDALRNGVASLYPDINGIPELKNEASRFLKAFVNADIPLESCVPVTGSMQGTYASFLVASQCTERDTILFLDPGFPVQKQQITVIGCRYESFDLYDCRGDKLRDKLDTILSQGHIAALIYSNPNNPAWFCLTDDELRIIGEAADRYDVIVIEDLAYFAMDFRKKLGTPFQPPYQPSIAHHARHYILHISGSKVFSYAGQRIAVAVISPSLYHRPYPRLMQRYGSPTFGAVYIHRVLYALSSGTSHSAQCALAAMFRAATDGNLAFLSAVSEYGRRADRLKKIFTANGFRIVYDLDIDQPIADGFYFTITYPGLTGNALMQELIFYGISAISLSTTGSTQQGLRICTSFIRPHQYDVLGSRLQQFHTHHPYDPN